MQISERFYLWMAGALALTAFAGFAPTYFLRPVFAPAAPLTPLMHVHGALFSAWVALLVVQASLVAARRTDVHRRLGIAGAVLAAAMIPAGILLALESARRGLAPQGLDPLTFAAVPLGSVVMFAAFAGAGLANRRRPAVHRRLMILATVAIITPALARLVGRRPTVALALTPLFVLAAIAYDYRRERRLHPVYLWGGLVILLSGPVRIAIGRTDAWHALMRTMLGH